MNNRSQSPQPAEPDMALLYLGSLFETLDYMLPPERDEAMLDAPARHILGKRPKTQLGLAIKGQGGEAPPPVSLDGRFRQAPDLRSGCSRRDRLWDAGRMPHTRMETWT